MAPQSASGLFEIVMKSAVMNMLVTPASSSISEAAGLSAGCPAMNVAGPPTGTPTENLTAFGFGVGSSLITGMFLSTEWVGGQLSSPFLHDGGRAPAVTR